jgi:DNA polymerase I-like protein with 3'-5' exonuclease and polymerase domains
LRTVQNHMHLMPDIASGQEIEYPLGTFLAVYSEEHFHWLEQQLQSSRGPVVVDLETWSPSGAGIDSIEHFERAELALTAIKTREMCVVIVHYLSDIDPGQWLQTIVDSERPVVMHNANYDARFFRRYCGRIPSKIIDTMVLYGLVLAGRSEAGKAQGQEKDTGAVRGLGLANGVARYFNILLDKGIRSAFYGKPYGLVVTEEELRYAAMDVVATEILFYQLLKEIEENDLEKVAKLEIELTPVVLHMNTCGITIDRDLLLQYEQQLMEQLRVQREEILDLMAQDHFTVVGPPNSRLNDLYPVEPALIPQERKLLSKLGISQEYKRLLHERYGLKMSQAVRLFRDNPNAEVDVYTNIYDGNLGNGNVRRMPIKEMFLFESAGFWNNYIKVITGYGVRNTGAQQLGIFVNACRLGEVRTYPHLRQIVLAERICNALLRYRPISKVLSGFIKPWKERTETTNKIYTTFLQTRTDTGRFSSTNPNMQNVPRPNDELGINMRDVVIAPHGYLLVTADYSQYELRVAAQLAGEERMITVYKREADIRERLHRRLQELGIAIYEHDRIEACEDEEVRRLLEELANNDLHRLNASMIFDKPQSEITKAERTQAKVISFGVLYGMQEESLSQRLLVDFGIPVTIEEARALLKRYFDNFPRLREYIERTKQQALTHGYVRTPFGRRRWVVLPDLKTMAAGYGVENTRYREEQERIGREMVNATIQSVNADATKIALVLLHRKLVSDQDIDIETEYPILTVHDEIVVQVKEHHAHRIAHYLLDSMVRGSQLAGLTEVPTTVEINVSKNWSK